MALYRVVIDIAGPSIRGLAANVWHVRTTDPGVDPDDAGFNQQIDTIHQWYIDMHDLMPPLAVASYSGEAYRMGDDPVYKTSAPAWTLAAGGTQQSAPSATALCTTWRTESASRSGRGRTFFSPLVRDAVDADGSPTAGCLNVARAAAQALVDSSTGADGGAIVVYSPLQDLARDVTGFSVRDRFAVLTSRRD